MILTLEGLAGEPLSLDLRQQLGERVEIECFHFITPPIEFRLVRNRTPLQEWQLGNTDTYDLQHSPAVQEWSRDGHSFLNDWCHRNDVVTCGVISEGLAIETRGLSFPIRLLVWPRESTIRTKRAPVEALPIIQQPPRQL